MKQYFFRIITVSAVALLLGITLFELNAEARAGSSRSMGSRGSRSYSRPASPAPSYQPPPRQQTAPLSGGFQQQQSGGFMRSMAGGLMGGMLGSMLFSSFAGAGGMGGAMGHGSGIGFFEIILLAGGGFLLYRFMRNRRS